MAIPLLVMKHRRTPVVVNNNRTTIGVNNDEESNDRVESFFPKRRHSNKKKFFLPLLFKLQRRPLLHWSAAIVVLVTSIVFFLYKLQLISNQRAVDRHRSNVPSNWRNPHDHSHLLQRCNIPFLPFEHNPIWTCYNDLVDENYDTVIRANQLFNYDYNYYSATSVRVEKEEERTASDESRIPHLLIFTHKYDIFNCTTISAYNNETTSTASTTSQPPNNIYTLAENAKAIVKAYSRIWLNDMHFVYLSDADCITAINATEPELVSHFTNKSL